MAFMVRLQGYPGLTNFASIAPMLLVSNPASSHIRIG